MTTYLNYSSQPQTPAGGTGAFSSGPGTPMSGVSTVAIKDGHEGIRHGRHHQSHRTQLSSGSIEYGTPTSADRLAQLGGLYGAASAGASRAELAPKDAGYFDRVAGWTKQLQPVGDDEKPYNITPGYDEGEDSGVEGMSGGGDSPQCVDDAIEKKITAKGADSPIPKFRIPLPQHSPRFPLPPDPTPVNPLAEVGLSVPLSHNPGPKNLTNIINASSSSTPNSSARSGSTSGAMSSSASAPSPASTETTNSVRNAQAQAKMLGPVIHDEGVVDTTMENSSMPARSASVEGVLDRLEILETENLDDLESRERVDGEFKERVEEKEERMVQGPPYPQGL